MNASMPSIGPYGRGRYHAAVAMTAADAATTSRYGPNPAMPPGINCTSSVLGSVASENSASQASALRRRVETLSPTATTSTVPKRDDADEPDEDRGHRREPFGAPGRSLRFLDELIRSSASDASRRHDLVRPAFHLVGEVDAEEVEQRRTDVDRDRDAVALRRRGLGGIPGSSRACAAP